MRNERIGRSAWYMVAEEPVPANATLEFASSVAGATGRWRRFDYRTRRRVRVGARAVASVSQWWGEAATVTHAQGRARTARPVSGRGEPSTHSEAHSSAEKRSANHAGSVWTHVSR